jgi:hypothetical protein
MKTFQQIYKILYRYKCRCFNKTKLARFHGTCKYKSRTWNTKKEFQNDYNFNNSNKIEEVIEFFYSATLIQDILKPEQIIDGNCKSSTIAHGKGFQPLGLFRSKRFKKYNFPTLFFEHKRQSFNCSYQKNSKLN